jgi:DNA repair photolyase
LAALQTLVGAGVPASAMVAPIIPGLNDSEIEPVLKAVSAVGVKSAGYVLLRLPLEVKDVFREWLMSELPDRASRVLSLIRQTRQGKEYDSSFGRRMTGTGPYAWSSCRRFELACQTLGLNQERTSLSTELFRRPPQPGEQMQLF